MQNRQVIDLAKIVGGGYGKFWNSKARFVVCKGSRGSKKSKTTALWHIVHMMRYPQANTLVVRKTERTLKDSVFSDLRWAIDRLGVNEFWKATTNPLELTYVPTGQRVIFRGFDDPLKITSISVPKGVLCWCWIEEAYEITKEEDFDMLNESIRGAVPEGLFKRFTITFNPWNDRCWLKRRFFDTPDTDDKIALTTTYRCNEWLDDNDRRVFEEMKIRNPRRWRVAANGEWGVIDGLIYDNWIEKEFDHREVSKRTGVKSVFGLDFGFSNDPTALFCGLIDPEQKEIYVFDEMYEKAMTNPMIAEQVIKMGYGKEKMVADCADPKSIEELYGLGLRRIRRSRKGRDSIRAGINYIQNYKIIIHPRCVNFLTEISNYIWEEDKLGNKTNKPIDDFNHCLVAGTMIETLKGEKPIEEVTTSDYVLTRQGYKKVAWSGVSDRNRTVYRVTTDTGHEIIGTNNHKILTQDGFCDIDSLRYGDNVLIRKWLKSSKLTERNGDATPTVVGEAIGNTSSAVASSCTTTSGNSIRGSENPDTSSTTLTETARTTTSGILKKSLTNNMSESDTNQLESDSNVCGKTYEELVRWQKTGTHPKKDSNGTVSTLENATSESVTCLSERASNVEQCSNQKQNTTDSAPTNAKPKQDERVELMTLFATANTVEKSFESTDIPTRDFAVGRVLTVEELPEKADVVYDLTIAECHEFFANGILVHNCMDAMRYALEDYSRGSLVGFD